MDLKKIKSFILLATSNSYRDAANKLNITQPTLTKQIQMLEERVGFSLFYRNNKGCYLTDAGKVLYKYAIRLNDEVDKFTCISKKIRTGKAGNLNIGYTFSFANILPQFINLYTLHHPIINIKILELDSEEQEERLLSGELDVGFMGRPVNQQIKFEEIGQDHLLIISNKNNHFKPNNLDELTVILENNTLCIPDSFNASELTKKINNFLCANSINAPYIHYTNNIHSIISMVNLSSNISILSNSLVNLFSSHIKSKALIGINSKWEIGMLWNQTKASLETLAFVEEIKIIKNDLL